ncbi:DUF1622 domain-containing protein [Terrisporobacter glycolicus]|nr:DUF1622 domain-containing protein [Terrisporobacter glycolicus]
MELKNILHILVTILYWLSVIVIIYGVMIQFIAFIISEVTSKDRKVAVENVTMLKNFLGTYILFALEILIGADIIESILDPTIDHILTLAALVVIRTIISYFLNKEIKSENKNSNPPNN